MKIVFATHNPNKVREINEMLDGAIEIIGLDDIGCTEDIAETQSTMKGNALQKARYVHKKYNIDCFSEDTGLEVDILNGAPGVKTARYAGESRNPEANMAKLLGKLHGQTTREAQFHTVIALILDGKEYCFDGIARGSISNEKIGEGGFGYDPVFIPKGYEKTFAQLTAEEKNSISHRGKATAQLKDFLLNLDS